jgi:hypothetical protein
MALDDEVTPRTRGGRSGGFLSGLLAKAKRLPAPYWVAGLGGGALLVDYLVEGEDSIASSLYRGIFGGGHEEERGGGRRGGQRTARAPMGGQRALPVITQPTTVPAGVPGLDYYVVPVPYYHPDRYFRAHEPERPHARFARAHEWHPDMHPGYWGGQHLGHPGYAHPGYARPEYARPEYARPEYARPKSRVGYDWEG